MAELVGRGQNPMSRALRASFLARSSSTAQQRAHHQEGDDGDHLAAENDSVHVQRRAPGGIAALDDVDAGRTGDQAKPGTTSFLRAPWLGAAAAASPAENGRDRDHDDAVTLDRLTEDPVHLGRLRCPSNDLLNVHVSHRLTAELDIPAVVLRKEKLLMLDAGGGFADALIARLEMSRPRRWMSSPRSRVHATLLRRPPSP